MKISPERPTTISLFAAWCGIVAGAVGEIYSLATYGLSATWQLIFGFVILAVGLATLAKSRRA